MTDPAVCEEILKTIDQRILKSMQAYLEDLEKSPVEALKMRRSDSDAFKLGVNSTNTLGKVFFHNELMALLHYEPKTKTTHQVPMLMTPAFINKYYVMDLEMKKLLVGGLLNSGYSVFMISWVNPDASLANNDFFDYMKKGPIAAIEVAKETSGKDKVNLLTLLTTLLDVSQPAEIANYVSEDMLNMIEQKAEKKACLMVVLLL